MLGLLVAGHLKDLMLVLGSNSRCWYHDGIEWSMVVDKHIQHHMQEPGLELEPGLVAVWDDWSEFAFEFD